MIARGVWVCQRVGRGAADRVQDPSRFGLDGGRSGHAVRVAGLCCWSTCVLRHIAVGQCSDHPGSPSDLADDALKWRAGPHPSPVLLREVIVTRRLADLERDRSKRNRFCDSVLIVNLALSQTVRADSRLHPGSSNDPGWRRSALVPGRRGRLAELLGAQRAENLVDLAPPHPPDARVGPRDADAPGSPIAPALPSPLTSRVVAEPQSRTMSPELRA